MILWIECCRLLYWFSPDVPLTFILFHKGLHKLLLLTESQSLMIIAKLDFFSILVTVFSVPFQHKLSYSMFKLSRKSSLDLTVVLFVQILELIVFHRIPSFWFLNSNGVWIMPHPNYTVPPKMENVFNWNTTFPKMPSLLNRRLMKMSLDQVIWSTLMSMSNIWVEKREPTG